MEFSVFGKRFSRITGIGQLMEDLGEAIAGTREIRMLGGGNPAYIPEILGVLQERMRQLAADPVMVRQLIANYDPPRGNKKFIQALRDFFHQEYGWPIHTENIVLTSGSQSAFFMLFNLFAGEFDDGSRRKILVPLVPEYIGYTDVGLQEDLFTAGRPEIETFPDHSFKYHVPFHQLPMEQPIGAICLSRPTNPTGNLISDASIRQLLELAKTRQIPLIIDNAYGLPFPNILFREASLDWSEQIIHCFSLSKFGLPGVRTGIVIADPAITKALTRMNGIMNLALGNLGPQLFTPLIRSGEALRLGREVIMPYYRDKSRMAIEVLHRELAGIDYYLHKSEGAIFLWLWFPNLPITSEELYQRLKQRGVLVISGHHFFPGLQGDWRHSHECLRVSYAMEEKTVREGIRIIADEVKQLYRRPQAGQP